MNTYDVEYTDTFGGEANYAWVRRAVIEVADGCPDSQIVREAKAAMGLSGIRGRRDDCGESLAFIPSGSCSIMFVTFKGVSENE